MWMSVTSWSHGNSLPRLVVTLHVCVLCVYITCRSVPALLQFIAVGEYAHLDGFVLELPGEEFGHDVNLFGQAVYRTLKCLSDCDPSQMHCMSVSYLGQRGWGFIFNNPKKAE